jgi:hypothetical protein
MKRGFHHRDGGTGPPRRRGDRSRRYTGNLTASHLHFQLMDGADPLQANGLAFAFAAYLAQRGGLGSG